VDHDLVDEAGVETLRGEVGAEDLEVLVARSLLGGGCR
jgi:hypothetical protein